MGRQNKSDKSKPGNEVGQNQFGNAGKQFKSSQGKSREGRQSEGEIAGKGREAGRRERRQAGLGNARQARPNKKRKPGQQVHGQNGNRKAASGRQIILG